MVLAQSQTAGSMESNQWPRYKSIYLWTSDFQQKSQDLQWGGGGTSPTNGADLTGYWHVK